MKIVIWGYPLNSHTHSYIHSSFYKAFKHLGHDVYWFHDDEYPEDFDFDDFYADGIRHMHDLVIETLRTLQIPHAVLDLKAWMMDRSKIK